LPRSPSHSSHVRRRDGSMVTEVVRGVGRLRSEAQWDDGAASDTALARKRRRKRNRDFRRSRRRCRCRCAVSVRILAQRQSWITEPLAPREWQFTICLT
jgi:hypothetical protein